jgi:flagellar assembly protein FliH
MTSLFDFNGPTASDLPMDLVTRGFRGVSPLEFFALETPHGEQAAQPGSASHWHRELEEREDGRAAPDAERIDESILSERAQQIQAMLDAARADAVVKTRAEMQVEMEECLALERGRVDSVCRQFAFDRQRYFGAVEAQVVKLALSIAHRVLAHEAKTDPSHLTPVVRAALARVQDGTTSVLRVPQADTEQWLPIVSEVRDGLITLIGDERLNAGECVLETELGRVELGVSVQLAEIERGFSELLRRQGV